jgi:hypothetical protein
MKLQRYSVEDGEWHRADEQGRFCLAEDVEALEAENAALHDECDRLTAMMSSNEGGIDKKDLFAGICVALGYHVHGLRHTVERSCAGRRARSAASVCCIYCAG